MLGYRCSLELADDSGVVEPLGQLAQPHLPRRVRATAEVRRAIGRPVHGDVRSVAMSRNARSSSADSVSAAATRGFSPEAPAMAPSSDPYFDKSEAAVLGRSRRARQPVGRIAPQRDEVGHELRRDAVAALDLGGVDLVKPGDPGLQEHDARPLGDALVHVAVAGHDQRPAAGVGLHAPPATQQVVGLELRQTTRAPAERVENNAGACANCQASASGTGGPVGVVAGYSSTR